MPTALLIVDHGSRSETANRTLEEMAALIQRLRPELIVEFAHMEIAEPTIEQGVSACVRRGAGEIAVHPYMLVPGRHAVEDIPGMTKAVATRFPDVRIRVTRPLGVDEKIARVVLERAGL
jgi:sirohydrochlorin ferrochelatase